MKKSSPEVFNDNNSTYELNEIKVEKSRRRFLQNTSLSVSSLFFQDSIFAFANLTSSDLNNTLNETSMIYFTQLIYLKSGQEKIFDEFESIAIPLISKYRGQLLLRVRPSESNFIENQIDKPYEIHFGSFESEKDFEDFMKDEERKKFLHLKEQSIQSTLLIKGVQL